MNWSEADLARHLNRKQDEKGKKVARNRTGSASLGGQDPRVNRPSARSKFNAVKTEVDGISFHSEKEAKRYGELKCMVKARQIFRLQLQPRYRLCAFLGTVRQGNDSYIGDYVADFRYCNHAGCTCAWGCTVEDVKGFKTAFYKWKKKHFQAQYGIQIRET